MQVYGVEPCWEQASIPYSSMRVSKIPVHLLQESGV